MKTTITKQNYFSKSMVWAAVMLAIFAMTFQPEEAKAGMKSPPPEIIKAIIIGDRVVDIAYNLGVLPEAMSVYGCQWPMAKQLKIASQILGCPNCTMVKKKDTIPNALTKRGIKRVIVEKTDVFCLYRPKIKIENIAVILAGMDVKIEYVDFSQGLESAVRQTAKLLDREAKADKVIEKYKKQLAKVKTKLPKEKSGKKVIIFNGTYQPSTGKSTLRVEAPGGYADRFLLDPLGCVNVGDSFKPADGKANKGHYPVRKKKNGMVLDPMIKANPDIIVMTGDALAVQRTFADYLTANPAFAQVKAIRDMAVYALPVYVDSSVLEYPDILKKWATALVR
ncbi:MAG: ABC transporter substrate-binding protein [Desulfobacula sp.]|nr:ABC transporter substrate-binding protein [Desulfobacula sp.]